MNSVKTLVKEHENIMRMLEVIHQASLGILQGDEIDTDDFKQIIGFVCNYADRSHHGKEEEFFFRAMLDELGPIAEKLIRNGMLAEHDLGRLYVSDLAGAIKSYESNPTEESRLAVLVASGSYEQLLRRHIEKENDVVFTFGEKNLSEQSARWVEDGVRKFEEDPGNRAEREHQLTVLTDLEKKYLSF